MLCRLSDNFVWTFLVLTIFVLVRKVSYPRDIMEWPKMSPDKKTGDKVAQWTAQMNVNPEELGRYLEGDIMVTKNIKRNGVADENFRWPNGVIPYVISGDFNNEELDLINAAINDYYAFTCIKFKQRENERDYINIISNDTGCWTSVGRNGGEQIVNLQIPGCVTKKGTVIHEFMHVCGFSHEHIREDRDDYVDIIWNNILQDNLGNFAKALPGILNSYGVPYDYGSVMHYSEYTFAMDNNRKTIVTKVPNVTIGQRDGFSKSDILKINRMYNCDS